ncbi:hypothetical protein LCGC14_0112320 [marine sediment metagenome]|jgi:hypothetical protein|uniref:Type IV secretion system protein VirB10 n=2 Tax=root TaxID=1 RepID=A0A7V1FMN1_9RHOB|nr:DotG/IcmE/VirB10 family protein [Sulfitobacter litoralis]HDZ51499.1 hypothetical protein [Sulfitobacter litoralis]
MSEVNNKDENVEIPEAEAEDFGSQRVKKGLSPAVKFGIVIGGVFAIIGGSMIMSSNEIVESGSTVASVGGRLDSTPGGVIQSESPRYQQILEESNDEAADEAKRTGKTFIPTPERILQPIDDLEAGNRIEEEKIIVAEPEPVVAPVVQEPAPRVVQAPPAPPKPAARPSAASAKSAQQEENPYAAAMLSQMGSLAGRTGSASLNVVSVGSLEEQQDVAVVSTDAAELAALQAAGSTTDTVLVPAGEIIYAETLTSTNSDIQGSPVLVELTTGEYRGARLIGSFAVNQSSDSMVIQFSSMTLPDGSTVGVNAFAVDGMTAEAAVASDVERRYLKRYGPILASAFITSYAEARSEADQTLTSVGDDTVVIQGQRDTTQSLYAGLSAAAGAIGSDLETYAPKGPKVILRDGWPIAVMFTETVVAGN